MADLARLHKLAAEIAEAGKAGNWDEVARLFDWLCHGYDGFIVLDGYTVRGLPRL